MLAILARLKPCQVKKLSFNTIRTIFDAIGWWRRDWYAYRNSASVLAVTHRLNSSLSDKGVLTSVVHPGTKVLSNVLNHETSVKPKLLICSLDLEDPRKRTAFLLKSLENVPKQKYSLTLIGDTSESFQAKTNNSLFPARFLGKRSRDQVQTIMAEHDIFLFGSCLDDWGYVLIEAMSQGLCIVAPNLSPFDEIVGDAGVLYSPFSTNDLSIKLASLLAGDITIKRNAAQDRALSLFSRKIFGERLADAVVRGGVQ